MPTENIEDRVAEDTQRSLQIPVLWDGVENVPLVLTNQVLGQVGQQGEVILTFGQVNPPLLMGTPEQQAQQAGEIPFVAVKPVARLALTKAGLDDLVRVLQDTQRNYEQAQQRVNEGDER
ncbi:MAG: hypothetical protein H0U55_10095 [Rubrobacteraceae bacterium]|nr:hypothetical protein [Rubrobacteraceae bacterium]